MNRLVVIVGPTAVGKSRVAFELAKLLNAEIISGDSMSVYRGLDIGTAKPSDTELKQVPHHLINVRNPEESFSVVDFQQLAAEAVKQVNRLGKIPILVGGTGLYIQAFLESYEFNSTACTSVRSKLNAESVDDLYQRLLELDRDTAERIHPHDKKRIVRALEVIQAENSSLSGQKKTTSPAELWDCLVFGLTMNRECLYRRIDQRVEMMIQMGLLAEVQTLLQLGLSPQATALQAIGYKELVDFFAGRYPLTEAVQLIQQSSRRFAKRQLTWFRRMPYIEWIQCDEANSLQLATQYIHAKVAEKYMIQ